MKSISNCTQVNGKEIKGKVEVGDIFEKSIWGTAEPWTETSERSKIIVTSVGANSFTVVMLDSLSEHTIKYSAKNKYFFLTNDKSKIPSPFEFKVGDRIKDKDGNKGIVQAVFPDCILILFPKLASHAIVTEDGIKTKTKTKTKTRAARYFFVSDSGVVESCLDWNDPTDDFRFEIGNYHLTSAAAKKALKELKKLKN